MIADNSNTGHSRTIHLTRLRAVPETQQPQTLAEVTKAHVLAVYAQTGENKKATARILGIAYKSVYNKLYEYRREDSKAAAAELADRRDRPNTPSPLDDLTITISYQDYVGADSAAALDHLVIPKIMRLLNAEHILAAPEALSELSHRELLTILNDVLKAATLTGLLDRLATTTVNAFGCHPPDLEVPEGILGTTTIRQFCEAVTRLRQQP